MTVKGDEKELQQLKELIYNQDNDFLEKYWYFSLSNYYGIENIQDNEDNLSILIFVKWVPPLEKFNELSTHYPKLIFEVEYEEPSFDIFGIATIHNGSIDNKKKDPYDYYAGYGEFQDAIKEIKEMPYEKFTEVFLKENNISNYFESEENDVCEYIPGYGYLERHFVERIKDEDLSLLVNYEWCEDGKEYYKKRMIKED